MKILVRIPVGQRVLDTNYNGGYGWREGGGGGYSLFTRVIGKHAFAFLHPALAQTRDYSRSDYT